MLTNSWIKCYLSIVTKWMTKNFYVWLIGSTALFEKTLIDCFLLNCWYWIFSLWSVSRDISSTSFLRKALNVKFCPSHHKTCPSSTQIFVTKKKLNDNHHVNQRKLKYNSRLKFTWMLVCSRTGFLPPFMIKYNYYMLCFNTYLQLTKKGMKTTYVSLTASIICRSFISCFPSSIIKKKNLKTRYCWTFF